MYSTDGEVWIMKSIYRKKSTASQQKCQGESEQKLLKTLEFILKVNSLPLFHKRKSLWGTDPSWILSPVQFYLVAVNCMRPVLVVLGFHFLHPVT